MNADTTKKLKLSWLTASAVGVLMAAAQGAVAGDEQLGDQAKADKAQNQKMEHKMDQQAQAGPAFDKVDSDNDGEARWNDIEPAFQEQLSKANWNEQNVLDQFDTDNDQALNADEYENFKSILMAHVQAQGGQQQGQMEQGQQDQQQAQQGQQDQQYEQQAQLDEGQQTQQTQQSQDQQSQFEQGQQEPLGQQSEQAELEQQDDGQIQQQRDQGFQTDQDQQFESGQQQDQQYQTDQQTQQAQQDQGFQADQQQAQAGQQAQDIDSTLLTMPVDQVTKAEVVNSRGEEIGKVSEVVRNNSTGELGLVVRSGGILGIGGSDTFVSLGEVSQMEEGRLLWDTMLSKDELAEMPEFDETQYSEISGTEYATLEDAQERG
ncbi:hypothetical protein F6455_06760 [Proteobacteria bacterium 005FR1]|nr:hypothetical protein [Proteobacteria bacterium 005FR1]